MSICKTNRGGILFIASIISVVLEITGIHYSAIMGFLLRLSPTMFIFYFMKDYAYDSVTYHYLAKFGTMSLEIYIFHYFCFIGLDNNWLSTIHYEILPPLIQGIINVFFASFLICFSYILAKISNAIPLVRLIILGKK